MAEKTTGYEDTDLQIYQYPVYEVNIETKKSERNPDEEEEKKYKMMKVYLAELTIHKKKFALHKWQNLLEEAENPWKSNEADKMIKWAKDTVPKIDALGDIFFTHLGNNIFRYLNN